VKKHSFKQSCWSEIFPSWGKICYINNGRKTKPRIIPQKVHYLQHNLCAILALIKVSLEQCSEIPPGHGPRVQLCQNQPSLDTKTSPWLQWAPSPASGTSPALCRDVLVPALGRKLPQHSNNNKQLIWCWFSILSQRCRLWEYVRKLQDRGEKKTKTNKKEEKKVF